MNDDDLLAEVGQLARDERILADPRWRALARGELGADERAALIALAEQSAEGRAALEAYTPLDAADQAALVEGILAAAPPPARPRSLLGARLRRGAAGAALLAAAALAALWLRRGDPPLPAYVATIAGEQAQRAAPPPDAQPGGVARLGPGAEIEVLLRPAQSVPGAVDARAFLAREGVERAVPASIERSDDGALRLGGSYEQLFGEAPRGAWELVVVVGRPGALPKSAGEASAAAHPPWQIVRVPVVLVERR